MELMILWALGSLSVGVLAVSVESLWRDYMRWREAVFLAEKKAAEEKRYEDGVFR